MKPNYIHVESPYYKLSIQGIIILFIGASTVQSQTITEKIPLGEFRISFINRNLNHIYDFENYI